MGVAQILWDYIQDLCGHDEYNIKVNATFLISFMVYWGVGGLFTVADFTGKPKFLMKYRIQENVKTYPISTTQLMDMIKVVGLNQLLVYPVLMLWYYSDKTYGIEIVNRELPSMTTAIVHLAFFALCTEVAFYYSHRLLHHPFFYRRIHKLHHTWISPIAFASAYCHPVEHIFSNVIPIALGGMLLNSHIMLSWVYTIYATLETLTVHSGFHLPFLKSPEFHDFHHLKFNYNYGVTGLLDYLHGTDSLFRKSKQFVRDKRVFSLTPIKTLIP